MSVSDLIDSAAVELSELYLSRKGDQYVYERAIDLLAGVAAAAKKAEQERVLDLVSKRLGLSVQSVREAVPGLD